jgi:hypothetical protein
MKKCIAMKTKQLYQCRLPPSRFFFGKPANLVSPGLTQPAGADKI